MTDKEKLARKSLNALFLELPESVATHHQKIIIEALEEAKNISSNLPVIKSVCDFVLHNKHVRANGKCGQCGSDKLI